MKRTAIRGKMVFFILMLVFFIPWFGKVALSAPLVLRYSTYLPARNAFSVAEIEFMDRVKKKTNGNVKFEKFFDGTLIGAKDSWEELLRGTADIAHISAHTSPGEKVLALHLMFGMGWIGVRDQRTQLKIQKQLLKEFPELLKEWSDVKLLSFYPLPEVNFHSRKKVQTLSDMKGMQIRGSGSWPKATVEKLGASLVAIPSTEVYIALQKGILDGTFVDNSVLLTFRFAEVTPYTVLLGGVYPGINNVMCMNLNKWKRLPPEIQKIFEETGEKIDDFYIEKINEDLKAALDFAKEKKHEFISLPPQELAKLHDLLREEANEAAKKLDAKGLPGTKVTQRLYELIKQTR